MCCLTGNPNPPCLSLSKLISFLNDFQVYANVHAKNTPFIIKIKEIILSAVCVCMILSQVPSVLSYFSLTPCCSIKLLQ